MFELFRPFRTSVRDVRLKAVEESRRRLELELGKPLSRVVEMARKAYNEFSTAAWRYSAKVLATSLAGILFLTLITANDPLRIPWRGYMYVAAYEKLFFFAVFYSAIGVGIAIYLLSSKFLKLNYTINRKFPNLYLVEQDLAEDVARDAVFSAVKNEYNRQMQNAQDFVTDVREARLERESLRTAIESARASNWVEVVSVEDAERVLRHRLFLESSTTSSGSVQWSAVCVDSDPAGTVTLGAMESPGAATYGACFALFLETNCKACGGRLRCGEPYQLRYNPVGELFGPSTLSQDVPSLGTFRSKWLPERGCDIFEGGWFCAGCHDARKAPD